MSVDHSDRQAQQYDRIISDYDQHYYDAPSLRYRQKFILEPLLKGLDFSGKRVADLASGSGHTSLYLQNRFAGIELEGFDISPEAVRRYQAATGRPCHVLDLTRPMPPREPFDAAIIMGGLHHCVADLKTTLDNIALLLRPGGQLLMFEPNADYILEFARQLWYKADHYFDANTECALSHPALAAMVQGKFSSGDVRYFGGPAFFLIYNSLVFRIPHRVKAAIAPPLMMMEMLYDLMPGRWPFASFTARWVRTA